MDQRDRLLLQIELLKAQRTICDLSIELYTRDLAALDATALPSAGASKPDAALAEIEER